MAPGRGYRAGATRVGAGLDKHSRSLAELPRSNPLISDFFGGSRLAVRMGSPGAGDQRRDVVRGVPLEPGPARSGSAVTIGDGTPSSAASSTARRSACHCGSAVVGCSFLIRGAASARTRSWVGVHDRFFKRPLRTHGVRRERPGPYS